MKGIVLTAGYVCPTEAVCLVMSMLRSSSVVFRYTGLSKFMLFLFFSCQFRHIRYAPATAIASITAENTKDLM